MEKSRKEVLFSEIGKYCTDISKLVFGGNLGCKSGGVMKKHLKTALSLFCPSKYKNSLVYTYKAYFKIMYDNFGG